MGENRRTRAREEGKGQLKQRKAPARMCVTCRQMRQKRDLLRVARLEDGSVTVDATGKAQGRGAYVCKSSACVAKAMKQGRLERALDAKDCSGVYAVLLALAEDAERERLLCGAVPELPATSRDVGLQARALGMLGLAAKSGSVVSGSDACASAMRGGEVYLAVLADDASEGTKTKFKNLAADRGVTCVIFASMADLGRATGKPDRAVLALTDEQLAQGVTTALSELQRI